MKQPLITLIGIYHGEGLKGESSDSGGTVIYNFINVMDSEGNNLGEKYIQKTKRVESVGLIPGKHYKIVIDDKFEYLKNGGKRLFQVFEIKLYRSKRVTKNNKT